ncbi:MAG: sugar phosphate isomerase/epimerase [Chloroflexi bacterium]|nr:sugar phosphate isomerase/epimerase [Chloroflexota bacterium]
MTRLGFHCHDLNDFHTVITSNGLRRGEFYNFSPEMLPELKRAVEQNGLAVSVHAPLAKTPWYPTPPTLSFLCDVEPERRNLSLRMVEETMAAAEGFGAEYVVVHFPTPCSDNGGGVEYARLQEIVWESASHLADLSQKHDMPIHIEVFGPSPFLNLDSLVEITADFPSLQLCFDTGHMNIASQRDGFDLYHFAHQLAPFVGSIHVWNTRSIEDYFTYLHIPAHPSQKPEEGWVDIPRILGLILSVNNSCSVIMESGTRYPKALGGYDFRDGVKWVEELVAELS